ncbi:BTAD domain-containing putative transcriptional regulator [Rhodococcus maanshanensis]|uniref:BTAD domain-containing putative transcriptional regulator n=1 Tax=Rhodococcus maanshanensis TaxID=183556 RepID=UPI0022B5B978|nr:BTAD domain-containing putative transcriptional regulator [Rhodococcus maanshanensis]MCZ4555495.1 BTAD domain-containing putative transcriptional regulator [Rhodococcus maanshanensis]
MRFGVLGPLAVWTSDGTPVRVPEVKVRALLADLLVHHGRPVTAARLADDLWGEDLPGNPTNTLQTKVSQLRRALEGAEPGGRDLVGYSPPGYLLRVEAAAVDAGQFAALTARARATVDPRERAGLLAEALALWRGSAYADFADEGFAREAITRLEELRLTALEDHAEARLELGEHDLLADELGPSVAAHPLRERLRAAQVLALYLAGRQSEALASYGQLREVLAEELGVDPSPDLVTLYHSILDQDPGLLAAPDAAARARDNLPAARNDLIGRARELAEARDRLAGARLVTLTGPGGVGKTRLALAAAEAVAEDFPDGVWFVEFAELRRPAVPESSSAREVAAAVAAVLGIRDDAVTGPRPAIESADPADLLAGALRSRRLLLVLDNCEHVADSVATLVDLLLGRAPGLRVLATSQEPLAVDGEVLQVVPPLRLPDAEPDLADVERSAAVQLFTMRAVATAPGFVLDAGNARAVAAICRRLDGIPLALELAASRVRALGIHQLADRLDDRFRLLAAGRRGAPARQQTLRAVIDWSWGLLDEQERIVLRRLAVHEGGCALDAAEAVCAGVGVGTVEVLDLLSRLVDRSLVVVVDDGAEPRYRLLESVAAYSLERLHEAGEFEQVRLQHNIFYTELAERTESRLRGGDQHAGLRRLDAEAANIRAALDGAAERGEADLAVRIADAMAWYWFLRGRLSEGNRALRAALAAPGEAAVAGTARAGAWLAGFAMLVGEGTEPGERSRALLRAFDGADDRGGRARAQWFLAYVHLRLGALDVSSELIDAAISTFRELGDRWGIGAAEHALATAALFRGDLESVGRHAAAGMAAFAELGDGWGRIQATDVLATLAEIAGDYSDAARLHREGVGLAEELHLWTDVSYRLSGLGRIALLTGDFDESRELHERAMRVAAEQSHRFAEQFAEIGLALVARRTGDLDGARVHLQHWLEWDRRLESAQGIPFYGVVLILAELGFNAEQRGEVEQALALHHEGLAAVRETGDPRAIALALEGIAGAHAAGGRPELAARLLGAAAAARKAVGQPLPDAERGDVVRIEALIRDAVSAAVFTEEFDRGAARDLADVLGDPVLAAVPATVR